MWTPAESFEIVAWDVPECNVTKVKDERPDALGMAHAFGMAQVALGACEMLLCIAGAMIVAACSAATPRGGRSMPFDIV